jgi:acyl transferase domain-containing protein/acyl carrier protein
MGAVFAEEDAVQKAMQGYEERVSIAAINAPGSVVISGAQEAVEDMLQTFKSQGIDSRLLRVSHAFHSPLMEPILQEFKELAETITYSAPRLPIISNVTGKWARGSDLTSAEYWTQHIRQGVRFYDAMRTLDEDGYEIFLEIGAAPTLTGLGQQCLPQRQEDALWLPSLNKKKGDWEQLLHSLGELYVHGAELNWADFDAPYSRRKAALPTYPFQRKTHWAATLGSKARSSAGGKLQLASADYHPFLGQTITSPALGESVIFQSAFNAHSPDFLAEHVICGEIISPAAAHVSMVLSAVKDIFDTHRCSIEDSSFTAPLLVREDEERTVQVIIENTAGETPSFQIASRGRSSESWNEHCTGYIALERGTESPDIPLSLDEIKSRCPHRVRGSAFYEKFIQAGYDVGPHFQRIEQSWYGDSEALCLLKVDNTPNSYEVHPGLIDSIFQVMMLASFEEIDTLIAQDEILIPFNISKFQFHSNNFTDSIWVHVRFRPQQELLEGDHTVWNENGELLIEIKELVVKKVSKRKLIQSDKALAAMLYELKWQHKELGTKERQSAPGENWLIFGARQGIAAELEARLRENGNVITSVLPGKAYNSNGRYELDPFHPDDFRRLLDDATENGKRRLDGILVVQQDQGASLPATQAQGTASVLHLTQALARQNLSPRLFLVTSGVHAVLPSDQQVRVEQSPTWGLGNVIALEHPELSCVCVDLPFSPGPDDVEQLLHEIRAGDQETRVALRDGQRFVARLLPHESTKSAAVQQEKPAREGIIREDGTYLISGGTGALGLLVADWMSQEGAAHLVLVGRHSPRPEAESAIARLKENGADVVVMRGDVARAQDVTRILNQVKQTMPELKGIVHAAGVLDDGVLLEQTWERFEKVLVPKVAGSWNLHQLTQDIPLDFFVMFSSAASLLGSAGQGNYVAANAFLDSLAYSRRKQGLAAASINWGPWGQAGMAASVQDRLSRQGLKPIQVEDGLLLLEKAIAEDWTQMGVIDCDWRTYAGHASEQDKNGLFSDLFKQVAQTRQAGGQAETSEPAVLLELQQAPAEERHAILLDFIQRTAANVIGLDAPQDLAVDVSLLEQGFDSLMAVQLRTALGKSLGISLPVTLLFNYPTISAAVSYLLDEVLHFEAKTVVQPAPAQEPTEDELDYLDELSDEELDVLIEQELGNS